MSNTTQQLTPGSRHTKQSWLIALSLLLLLPATHASTLDVSTTAEPGKSIALSEQLKQSNPLDTAATCDSLWQKAVALITRDSVWEPGLIRSFTKYVDKNGYPKSIESFWCKHTPGAEGQVKKEIIKALKNGKDITEKKQERYNRPIDPHDGLSEIALGLDGTFPFDQNIQAQISSERLELKNPALDCSSAVAFSFTRQMESTAPLTGIAWLDEKTGQPLKLSYAPVPLPGRIKEMNILIFFSATPEGIWRATEINITAMGKFLFFTKRLQNSTTITDYWHRGKISSDESLSCR